MRRTRMLAVRLAVRVLAAVRRRTFVLAGRLAVRVLAGPEGGR